MFSKLLKYDFKALTKVGVILIVIALALGVVGSVDGFFVAKSFTSDLMYDDDASTAFVLLSTVGIFSLLFIVYGILACVTIMQVMIYINYYKTLCTDQGYLTFTLPVKQKDILLSKSVNAFIWNALIVIVALVCVVMIIFGIVAGVPQTDTPPADDSLFPQDYSSAILEIVFMLITAVLYSLNATQLIFMVIFFASVIAKKNKGVIAVLLVLATNFAYSTIASVISSIFSIIFMDSETTGTIIKYLIFIVLLVGTGIFYFITTKRMMERKLNLP